MHGKTDALSHDGRGVYAAPAGALRGHPLPLAGDRARDACRPRSRSPRPRATVRSWACATARWPARRTPLEGVQFHPESILTEHGHAMLKNFLEPCDERTVVDLRSDTVTRPTAAMRAGDGDAPRSATTSSATTRASTRCRRRSPALLGKEAALFVASGTQSNLVAIMSHCGRGDEYIVGQMAHTYRWEGGGAAVLGSVQPQPLEHEADGSLALARDRGGDQARRRALRQEPAALPREHDRRQGAAAGLPRGGARRWPRGAAWRRTSTARASSTPRSRSAATRGRGARIAAPFDSVSVCFSKGLGAPVGSALVGSREFIAARRTAGARWSAAACARPACVAAAAMPRARAPRRPAGRRPRARRAPRRRPAGPARPGGRAAADQHRVRRPAGRPRGRA